MTPEPGTRVRVASHEPNLRGYDGILVALTPDALVVDSIEVAFGSIKSLHVHRGQASQAGLGVTLGFLGGAVLGGVIGRAQAEGNREFEGPFTALGAGIGAGVGMIIGGVTGATRKTDRWEGVPINHLRVRPIAGGAQRTGFGLSFRF